MTGKERIMTALDRGQPDRVPVWELAFNESSIIGLARHFTDAGSLPPDKFFFDMDDLEMLKLIEAFKAMAQGLDLDGMTAQTNMVLERVDDEHVRDENGVVHHCSAHGEPYPVQGPIRDAADLRKFKMRSPGDEDYLLLVYMRSEVPDKAVAFMLPGPFFMSWSLRGSMENLLLDYMVQPALAHDLARMTTDFALASVDRVADLGADFIVIECDLAFRSGTLMSPDHYDEFIGPYYAEIVDHAHARGMKAVKHSDGRLTSFIPHFVENGFDAIHPIQPQCMDIAEVKRDWGDRLCVMGNIDCSFLLPFGTPEEVRASVRETIDAVAPGGGYIISSSNTIHPGCKPENYIAMVEAAREFGRYPELAGG